MFSSTHCGKYNTEDCKVISASLKTQTNLYKTWSDIQSFFSEGNRMKSISICLAYPIKLEFITFLNVFYFFEQ